MMAYRRDRRQVVQIGHKGKICKHELCLNYKYKRMEVLPHAAALQLGTRLGKNRPKNTTMEKSKEAYFTIYSTNRTEEEQNTPVGEDEVSSDLNVEDWRVEARNNITEHFITELDGLLNLLGGIPAAHDLHKAPAAVAEVEQAADEAVVEQAAV